jgi:hypothetical protein
MREACVRYSDAEIDVHVAKMYSTSRVKNFISNAERWKNDYAVQAGRRRRDEILLLESEGKSDFHNDFMRYVEAYERVLSGDVGRRRFATYTRRKIKTDGAMAVILDLLDKPPKTYGLNFLRRNNRLDCAYENIIIDYHAVYPDDIRPRHLREAKDRLSPVYMLLPPFPILRDRT